MRSAVLRTVFLDAGNTLVSMDWTLLAELLAAEGIVAAPGAIARAEAAARPALSRWLASGVSTEAGETLRFYVRRTLSGLPAPPDGDRERAAQRLVTALRRVGTRRLWSRPLPGVHEALAALRAAGMTLAVVSNADGTVEEGLVSLGLRDHFNAVVDSARVGVEKPDPRIFAHALAAVGARPEAALHVGDLHAVDVVGARAAGIEAVLLDPYGDWGEVDCARAPDLPAVVRGLLG
ncbi:MAG TPA: HAD-IA family hydrolase [Candidatus Binatia bacterium]|nr:HAD-IA family hydrolase [Candidatus Binatia bacterium]